MLKQLRDRRARVKVRLVDRLDLLVENLALRHQLSPFTLLAWMA
ncbi:MAG: hypothetical protein Q7T33_04800 [Dehalococcoidia bacterium]|nr:hypothetical protein [Dehalococcoidia bacterium]